jgi:hypothetical protein
MSSLNLQQIQKILTHKKEIIDYYKPLQPFECFVETGTHIGSTIFALQPYFKQIISIEIAEHFYNHCKHTVNSRNFTNINLLLGDSSILIEKITTTIPCNIIFFLDGHYSSENTGRGKKDCPLIEELELISKRNNDDIIIIDDYRLFETSITEDWSNISLQNILNIFSDRNIDYFILDDRLCLFIRKV